LKEKPKYVRFTIGWRALDDNVQWWDNGKLAPLPYEEALKMHHDYVKNTWPKIYSEISSAQKKAAF